MFSIGLGVLVRVKGVVSGVSGLCLRFDSWFLRAYSVGQ